jgi:SAM-dependent methyltransferase
MQNTTQEQAAAFFDSHVGDYEATHYGVGRHTFMTERQRRVLVFVDELNLPKGARVLDAGCGPGLLLQALTAKGVRGYGLDASPAMVERARGRLARSGPDVPARVLVGGIERLPFHDGTFDVVCSTGVIEYLSEDREALSEFFRVLRPGGRLILSVTNAWSPVNSLEPLLEAAKRTPWLCGLFNAVARRLGRGPVLPRRFVARRHRPSRLKEGLRRVGLELTRDTYFFFMPWPRPFDRVFPRTTERVSRWMDRLRETRLAPLGEGYLTVSRRPLTRVGPHGSRAASEAAKAASVRPIPGS